MKHKLFGAEGLIKDFPFPEHSEILFAEEDLVIKIQEGKLVVNTISPEMLLFAEKKAILYLQIWGWRQRIPVEVVFATHWRPNDAGGRIIDVEIHEKITARDIITAQVITGKSRIITVDAKDFSIDKPVFDLARIHPALERIFYYYNKALSDRSYVAMFNIVEAIYTDVVQSNRVYKDERDKFLATFIGKDFQYIRDLTDTLQLERHDQGGARLISDDECLHRIERIMSRYIKHLSGNATNGGAE